MEITTTTERGVKTLLITEKIRGGGARRRVSMRLSTGKGHGKAAFFHVENQDGPLWVPDNRHFQRLNRFTKETAADFKLRMVFEFGAYFERRNRRAMQG